MADGNFLEGVLGIEDAEINGYLNTKKEMLYKKIIWENMNKDYAKGKTLKQAEKGKKIKKDANPKRIGSRSVAVDSKMENERKRKRISSKVNLDVLKKLTNDDPEAEAEDEAEPENSMFETQSPGECNDDDKLEQYENEYDEDIDYRNEDEEEGYVCYEEDCDYEDY